MPLQSALGRVVARDIEARVSLPPFPSSAMDGYAFAFETDRSRYQLVGQSLAGHPWRQALAPGTCVRITTGAALPDGADSVAIQEECDVASPTVNLTAPVARGDNVRQVGNDVHRGTVVVAAGRHLNAFDIGTLAACGVAELEVWRRPTVAVFSTGDELTEPGTRLEYGQIYDSNRWAVTALLNRLPVEVDNVGVLPDDPDTTLAKLREVSERNDALVTSGGVSVGDADYVKDAIEQLGELSFWRLNLKPGKPVAFGRLNRCLLFGLPGNPVSTIVTSLMIARPALLKLAGAEVPATPGARARVTEHIRHRPGREEFQRGHMQLEGDSVTVRVTGEQGSNRLTSFSDANCLIRIPKDFGDVAPGTEIDVLPFAGLLN